MRIRKVILALVLLTTSTWADPASEARKAIQAAYDASSSAASKADLEGTMACHRADFIFTDTHGRRFTLTELREMQKSLLKNARKIRASSKIVDFQLHGDTATVQVREHFQGEMPRFMGKPTIMNEDDTAQDVWVRGPEGWRKVSSTNLTDRSLHDGKNKDSHVGYVRVIREQGHPTALETSVTRFVSKTGQSVDLVGAVHLGEKSYYRQLNRDFKAYDAVLYELIAPHGGERLIPRKGEKADNALSSTQLFLTDLLGLSFQLDEVDYSQDNFVHADLSPDELARSMRKRGESVKSMVFKLISEGMSNPAMVDPADALALNFSLAAILTRGPTRGDQAILRRVLASSFQQMEQMMDSFSGPDGSSLITVRNERALEVMRQEFKHGRRRLAIFYGAGHMADMEARLLKMGFQKQSVRFLKAWDLRDPKKKSGLPGLLE